MSGTMCAKPPVTMILIAKAFLGSLAMLALLGAGRLFADEKQGGEIVVLLHGLGRTHLSMVPMEDALVAAGYNVRTLKYPSTRNTVQEIADAYLAPLIARCQNAKPKKIHFVTHSLGGIALRNYLATNRLDNIGRIVMLGPPSQGSEVVDELGALAPFDWINGPAGRQLGTDSNSLPNRLPIPTFEVGIIAGNRSINPILSALIPGPDDGKVALARARLEGMKDFAVVSTAHPFLMRNRESIALTLAFLRTGRFDGGSAPPSEKDGEQMPIAYTDLREICIP